MLPLSWAFLKAPNNGSSAPQANLPEHPFPMSWQLPGQGPDDGRIPVAGQAVQFTYRVKRYVSFLQVFWH